MTRKAQFAIAARRLLGHLGRRRLRHLEGLVGSVAAGMPWAIEGAPHHSQQIRETRFATAAAVGTASTPHAVDTARNSHQHCLKCQCRLVAESFSSVLPLLIARLWCERRVNPSSNCRTVENRADLHKTNKASNPKGRNGCWTNQNEPTASARVPGS